MHQTRMTSLDFRSARDRIQIINKEIRALEAERSSLESVLQLLAIKATDKPVVIPKGSDGRFRVLIERHAETGEIMITSTKFLPGDAIDKIGEPIDPRMSLRLIMVDEAAARSLSRSLHSAFVDLRISTEGRAGYWYHERVRPTIISLLAFAHGHLGIDEVETGPVLCQPSIQLPYPPDPALEWPDRHEQIIRTYFELLS